MSLLLILHDMNVDLLWPCGSIGGKPRALKPCFLVVAMADAVERGAVRGEALTTPRGAWYVCYPGTTNKQRIITFRQDEFELAEQTLHLFRKLFLHADPDKPNLQRHGTLARDWLRKNPTTTREELEVAVLAAIGPVAPAAMEHVQDPPHEKVQPVAEVTSALAEEVAITGASSQHEMQVELLPTHSPVPQILEQANSPPPPPPITRSALVDRAKSLMRDWSPRAVEESLEPPPEREPALAGALSSGETSPIGDATPMEVDSVNKPASEGEGLEKDQDYEARVRALDIQEAMIRYAADIRKTGRWIGIFGFLVYALTFSRRVHLFLANRLLDIIAEFASWAVPNVKSTPFTRVAIFCRIISVDIDTVPHIIMRHIRDDGDLRAGNHWVAALRDPRLVDMADSFLHEPCGGRFCAGGGKACLAPLRRFAAEQQYSVVPTQAAGDCGIDVMAFWEGVSRNAAEWKKMRLSLAKAIVDHAADEQWQECFVACGEMMDVPRVSQASEVPEVADALTTMRKGDLIKHIAALHRRETAVVAPSTDLMAGIKQVTGLTDKDSTLVRRLAQSLPEAERAHVLAAAKEFASGVITHSRNTKGGLRRRRNDATITMRRAYGKLFAEWCADNSVDVHGRLPWGTMTKLWDSCASNFQKLSPKILIRSARGYLSHGFHLTGRFTTVSASGKARRRLTGGQGRPPKAPALRQLLFEWFCSIRGAVKTRLPPAALAAQARLLREEYLRAALRLRQKVDVPQITSQWLMGWRRQFQVSLRTPNRRWKVSRPVCLERCRITWLNIIRIRILCILEHGYDPDIDAWDQKPFHFNESGSQMRKSLHWKGIPEVPLKECQAATRARWSATTYCSSNAQKHGEWPPLEALFKGGPLVEQRLDDMLCSLCAGGEYGDLHYFSVQVGPKGSYRVEHVLQFLRRHLEPASESRRWKIILADYYGPHADNSVFDLCWNHMYVLTLIGGGITGILQVPDTHLHHVLSQRYTELEMIDLLEQQRQNPQGCPSRARESCVRDLLSAWCSEALHALAARGFWDNLLRNNLEGTEDHLGRGMAKKIWDDLDMPALRAQAVQDIRDEWHAGRLRWRDVPRILEPFPRRGQLDVYVEGQEDEGDPDEIQSHALAWNDREDVSSMEGGDEVDLPAAEEAAGTVVGALNEAQKVQVAESHRQLEILQKMRDDAKELQNPRLQIVLEALAHQATSQSMGARQKDAQVAQVVRGLNLQDEERVQQLRRCGAKPDARPSAALAAKSEHPVHPGATALRWRSTARRHSAAPRGFDAADLGQGRSRGGTQLHMRNRRDLFARVVAKFNNLEDHDVVNLDRTFRCIDDSRRLSVDKAWGSEFANEMRQLMQRHEEGDLQALRAWLARWKRKVVPRAEVVA